MAVAAEEVAVEAEVEELGEEVRGVAVAPGGGGGNRAPARSGGGARGGARPGGGGAHRPGGGGRGGGGARPGGARPGGGGGFRGGVAGGAGGRGGVGGGQRGGVGGGNRPSTLPSRGNVAGNRPGGIGGPGGAGNRPGAAAGRPGGIGNRPGGVGGPGGVGKSSAVASVDQEALEIGPVVLADREASEIDPVASVAREELRIVRAASVDQEALEIDPELGIDLAWEGPFALALGLVSEQDSRIDPELGTAHSSEIALGTAATDSAIVLISRTTAVTASKIAGIVLKTARRTAVTDSKTAATDWTLLERNALEAADRERGRFRSFLLTAFKHFLADEWDKAKAKKRGGGRRSIPLNLDSGESRFAQEPMDDQSPERLYEKQWALTFLDHVLNRLGEEFAAKGKERQFHAFKPFLAGETEPNSYEVVARALGISATAAKVAAHRTAPAVSRDPAGRDRRNGGRAARSGRRDSPPPGSTRLKFAGNPKKDCNRGRRFP